MSDIKELKEKVWQVSSENEKVTRFNFQNVADKPNNFSCRECNETFTVKKELRQHIEVSHQRIIKCNMCDDFFNARNKLEEHLIQVHKRSRIYNCTECDMAFVSQWRLKKHIRVHEKDIKVRTCHFYNNGKICPFAMIGCKFSHKEANMCSRSKSCSKTMCQYRHS